MERETPKKTPDKPDSNPSKKTPDKPDSKPPKKSSEKQDSKIPKKSSDKPSFRSRLIETVLRKDNVKPEFKFTNPNSNPGSPVSPLPTRVGPTTSSSSSSSGSVSSQAKKLESRTKSHSGELSGSVESSPKSTHGSKPGRTGSDPGSPARNVVQPGGNIFPSGRVIPGMMANESPKTAVLGSGGVDYGYGNVVRRGGGTSGAAAGPVRGDAEEMKKLGNEKYRIGSFEEAIGFYDMAIKISPNNATYRFNKAVALTGLRIFSEAVREFEEAIRLDPQYVKAHHKLGSLFVRLGQVENARRHLCFPGQQPDPNELNKMQKVETILIKCTNFRKANDWKSVLKECNAIIAAGAESSPQLFACKAEALLKLNHLDEANKFSLSKFPISEELTFSIIQSKFFDMLSGAYLYFVRAEIEMAFGRFDNAVILAEKAEKIDPRNAEIMVLLNNVKGASKARIRGNDLYKKERFTEACTAYSDGLKIDPSNSVLYCNRAACYFKIGKWKESLDDSNKALLIRPNYTKALLRRAASSYKLEKWSDAVRDYEAVRPELPDDKELAENLFHAQIALKQLRGEAVYNLKFGGEVESVSGLNPFKAAISSTGVSIVHFYAPTNAQCIQVSPFLDTLCARFPSVSFYKVDVEESFAIATSENVKVVPTFKIYRNGKRINEMVVPNPDVLESSVRHYSL